MFANNGALLQAEAGVGTYCAIAEALGGSSASNGGEEDHGLLHLDGGCGVVEQRLLGW